MRVYYRPPGSPLGFSTGTFGSGVLAIWFLVFILPFLCAYWMVRAFWWLSGQILGTHDAVLGWRLLFCVVTIGGLATLGAIEQQTVAAHPTTPGLTWLAHDPRCDTSSYTDTVTSQPCTPQWMYAGRYHGVLVNDPNCVGNAELTNAARACTEPPSDPIPSTWLKNDPHCDRGDYRDLRISGPSADAPCTPPGMRSGNVRGILINDPNCDATRSVAALSGSEPTDPLSGRPCYAPPGI